jgi:serine/threonine protein kinase
MARELKTVPTAQSAPSGAHAIVDRRDVGEVAVLDVAGLVDELFVSFGDLNGAKTVVLNVGGITRLTSFGVRQWLRAMQELPKSLAQVYLLGCPTFFVDQLNMVLNFGGPAKILTVVAPYTCSACGVESGETIDVLAEQGNLAKGAVPEKECARCGNKLEFDETAESYFAFVRKYGAATLPPAIADALAALGLYTPRETASEKPPRTIKLVHGAVTYFRISGTIGSMFRARPFLVGAEGEVVIDLAEVDRFERAGLNEWRRLLRSLAGQVPAVTLVDVTESILVEAGASFTIARNIAIASVLVPYRCSECGISQISVSLENTVWPPRFGIRVCATCGGPTRSQLNAETLDPLEKVSTVVPPGTAKVIAQRDEIMSRALTDAKVAQASELATAHIGADDMILGKYKIVRRLQEGGMAEVFLAKQVGIGGFEKPVALKRIQHKLLESRHTAIDMFLNEAKIAGRLMHPNIVQVLDVGEVQGALYLAMEYVHGKDVREVLQKLKQKHIILPLGEACHIAREVAQALHHAYWSTDIDGNRLAVVHRDVSPQNIILSYDGTVKLLDFGVAMSAVTEHAEALIVGKWLYMSPEATSNRPIDHRSDLFSLGVVLYLLCSGSLPFTGRDPKEIVRKIRSGDYTPLQVVAQDCPPRLAALVGRMLATKPEDRPQSGQEVATELTDIAREIGIESSSRHIAQIVSHLFPDEARRPDDDTVAEPDDSALATVAEQPTLIATPSARTPPPGLVDTPRPARPSPSPWRPSAMPNLPPPPAPQIAPAPTRSAPPAWQQRVPWLAGLDPVHLALAAGGAVLLVIVIFLLFR